VAVTLRDGGGIYWVPSVYAAELRRLQGAVEKIGASRVHVLPVHESQDASPALGAIASASLEAELAQLQAEIAAFVSMPPERTSTLPRRLEASAALRERAKLYRSVLAITVTDLDRQLDMVQASGRNRARTRCGSARMPAKICGIPPVFSRPGPGVT
jgi:hypothetical protein